MIAGVDFWSLSLLCSHILVGLLVPNRSLTRTVFTEGKSTKAPNHKGKSQTFWMVLPWFYILLGWTTKPWFQIFQQVPDFFFRKGPAIYLEFEPVFLPRFPSLINCATVDWYDPWPQDALVSVAERCEVWWSWTPKLRKVIVIQSWWSLIQKISNWSEIVLIRFPGWKKKETEDSIKFSWWSHSQQFPSNHSKQIQNSSSRIL